MIVVYTMIGLEMPNERPIVTRCFIHLFIARPVFTRV